MRILLVCEAVFPHDKGGVERWFQQVGNYFTTKGHSVTYFNSASVSGLYEGINYVASSDKKWGYKSGGVRSKTQAVRFAISLYRWLRNYEGEAIYCSAVPIISIFAVAVSNLRKRRMVFIEWFEIWPLKYWIKYVGYIAGVVGWLMQFFALQLGNLRVVYSSRASSQIKSKSISRRPRLIQLPGLCPSNIQLTLDQPLRIRRDSYFLGRLVSEKQPLLFVETAFELSQEPLLGHFWIMGTGPLAEAVKTRIKELGLESKVTLLENPPDEQILQITSNCFLLFNPSIREGYGLVSVEAAYQGIPVMLINYPDNASIDLEICPELVIEVENLDQIKYKYLWAFEYQKFLRDQSFNWAVDASKNRSADLSLARIEALINRSKG
jgi:glycosyltransferase involved in cell wall biosynthesis